MNDKLFDFNEAVKQMQNGKLVTNTYQQYGSDIKTSFELFKGVLIFKRNNKPVMKNLTEAELINKCWFLI